MAKRVADDSKRVRGTLYHFVFPKPNWPRHVHNVDSAVIDNVNTPAMDAASLTGWSKCPCPGPRFFIVSRLIQALDLANFDDYELELDDDLNTRTSAIELRAALAIRLANRCGSPDASPTIVNECPLVCHWRRYVAAGGAAT